MIAEARRPIALSGRARSNLLEPAMDDFDNTGSLLITLGTVLVVLHVVLRYGRGWFARMTQRADWFAYPKLWVIDWVGAIGLLMWAVALYRASIFTWPMVGGMSVTSVVVTWFFFNAARRGRAAS
jgi:hypothetical protein